MTEKAPMGHYEGLHHDVLSSHQAVLDALLVGDIEIALYAERSCLLAAVCYLKNPNTDRRTEVGLMATGLREIIEFRQRTDMENERGQ